MYPPEHAPAGVMMAELAEDLAVKGHRVTVITGFPSHPTGVLPPGWKVRWRSVELDALGFRVVRCGHGVHRLDSGFRRAWYYLTFGFSTFVNGGLSGPFDVLLCLSTPVFGVWAAWLLARLKRARFVYGIFDLHPEAAANAGMIRRSLPYRMLRAIDTLLCRHADSIVTVSAALRAEILARGIDPEKVTVVPLWLDGRKIQPGPRDNAWRREQRIPPETFVALYAGTIGYVSGADVLIEAARLLAAREDILILCVGEGPIKDRLETAAANSGLPNIRFLPFQPAGVLGEVQASGDVGLVTLLPDAGRTSFPSKVLGYLAAARPVLASVAADSDTAKLIEECGCGRVTPCLDPVAIARAIRDLADHPADRFDLGKRGRACFERLFERGPCGKAYERLLCGTGPGSTVP